MRWRLDTRLAHESAVATGDVEVRAAKTRFPILLFGVGMMQLARPAARLVAHLHAEPQYQDIERKRQAPAHSIP